MSTARSTATAASKDNKRAHRNEGEEKTPSSHLFRNALLVSLALAALILWQLYPIIHGLHNIESTLVHAEGVRRVASGLISVGYHKLASVLGPLYVQVFH